MSWDGSEAKVQLCIFGLPGTQIEYTKLGFQRPVDGNQAKVNVVVSLPCAQGKDELDDEYVWGESIKLLENALTPEWGSVIVKGRRSMVFTAMGETFAEAFEGAEADIERTFAPLVKAYRERKEKLRDAEWRPSDSA